MNLFDLMATLGLDSSSYEKGLDNAEGKANGFGSKLKSGLSTAAKAAGAALTAATTAAVGFGVSSVKTGEQFDASMSQVAATMGYTVDELNDGTSEAAQTMEQLRGFAQNMGSSTAFSASQAADALNYMALAGYDAETSMNMLPNVLNLAAAGGIELAQASDMVTDAQTALGLSLDETSIMVDQMAKASSKSNTSVAQLGDAILTIGANARSVRGGTTELNTVLGVLADNGIKGSEAGTHLRNMILSLQNPTDDAAESMAALGVSVYDADGNMRALPDIFQDINNGLGDMDQASKDAIVSGMFNKTDLAAANALLGTSVDRFDELTREIKSSTGAAEAMANVQLDNLSGDITLFQSALEGAKIAVSDELTPSVREFVQFGTDSISTLTEALRTDGLDGVMDALGTIIAEGLSLLIEKVPEMVNLGLTLLQALITGIIDNLPQIADAAIEIISTIGSALIKNGPELLTSFAEVLGQIITKITDPETLGGFIQGVVTLITTMANTFIENIPAIVDTMIQIMDNLLTVIQENLPMVIDAAIQIMTALVNGLVEALPRLIEYVPTIIETISQIITENLPVIIDAAITILNAIIDGLMEALPTLIGYLPTIIDTISSVLIENLPTIIHAAIDIMNAIIEGLIEALPILISYLPTILDTIASVIFDNLPTIINAGFDLIQGLIQGIISNLPAIIDSIATIIGQMVQFILANLPEFIQRGMDLVMSLIRGIMDNLPSIVSTIGDLIGQIILALIQNLPQIFIQGQDIMMQLILGLIEMIPQLIAAIPQIIRAIIEAFANADWGSIGRNIMDGIKNGIINMAQNVANAAKEAVSGIVSGVKGFLGIHSPSTVFRDQVGEMIGAGLAEGIDRSASEAIDSAEEMAENVLGTMDNMDTAMSNTIGSVSVGGRAENGLTNGGAGVTINVYGAVGQDVSELAEIVSQKIALTTQRERVAWA